MKVGRRKCESWEKDKEAITLILEKNDDGLDKVVVLDE